MMVVKKKDSSRWKKKKQEKIKEARSVAVKKERPVKDVKKEDKNKM